MKKSWWKTLLTKGSASTRISELEQELAETRRALECSRKNVAINSRRRDRLRVDHPEIYQRYFTKKGLKNEL